MHAELPVLSFLCAILLIALATLGRIHTSVPHLVLVSWLLICNAIHGANSLIWAGNVDIRNQGWCDIATKILLGMIVALLVACLTISCRVEFISSTRDIPRDPRSKRTQTITESALCILLPVIYMSLHYVVQDHRFDLIENYGCSASIHPSIPALIIIWLPPLILSVVSLGYSGLSIYNLLRRSSESNLSSYIESRFPTTLSYLILGLSVSIITTSSLFILINFSIFSVKLEQWTSWSAVHRHFYDINILQSTEKLAIIRFSWWVVPALSLIYVGLSIAAGGEGTYLFKWLRASILCRARSDPRPGSLSKHVFGRMQSSQSVSRSPSLTTSQSCSSNLKSGWDDMLVSKTPRKFKLVFKAKKASIDSVLSSPELPLQSPRLTCREDDLFMASTLNYLGSSTAQTLGLSKPLNSPPSAYAPPPVPSGSVRSHLPRKPSESQRILPIPEDAVSTISSIYETSWPHPPTAIPRPSSSDTFGFPLYPTVTPPHRQSPPFQGNISPITTEPASTRQPLPRRNSKKELRNNGSRDQQRELIYMTVVKEVSSG